MVNFTFPIPIPNIKLPDGISTYKQLRELRDEHNYKSLARYYYDEGNELLDHKKPAVAMESFENALKYDSKNPEIFMGLHKCTIFLPIIKREPLYYDLETTIPKLNKILEKYPNDRHTLYFLGEVYRDIDYNKAKSYFNKVIGFCPKSYLAGLAHNSLAFIAATEKDNELAFHHLRIAKGLCEFNPQVLNNLSYNYLIRGHYQLSIDTLVKLLDNEPYKIIAYWNIINALRSFGDFSRAFTYNRKLINCLEDDNSNKYPDNFSIYFFQTDPSGEGVYFKNLTEKKYYSYCSIALTDYILDKSDEADMYLEEAQSLGFCEITSSIKFLCYNIECIQKNNGSLTYKLDEIKQRILKLDSANEVPKIRNKKAANYFLYSK
jgi:tetratricopeptide (TPR) repeat protein